MARRARHPRTLFQGRKSDDDQSGNQQTLDLLESIQRRVLWLATNIIHHANNVRPNPDEVKVGGPRPRRRRW
ncbi:MAG: hypothetical protein R2932_59455 [Caldilineaceae bacterium]